MSGAQLRLPLDEVEAFSSRSPDGVEIGEERWADIALEVMPLASAHFSEVEGALASRRPFALNSRLMAELEAVGVLHIFCARVDGVLAGYISWNVQPDVESDGLIIAIQGALYVAPQYTDLHLGIRLFDYSIEDLKTLGVEAVFPHHRLEGRSPRVASLMRRRGAIAIKTEYFLWIGESGDA